RCLCRCFCSYRALPCFPTRRSSDLVDDTAALATGDTLYLHIAAAVVSVVFDGQVIIDVLRTGSGKGAARDKFRAILLQADIQARSEEHTSELQSRENLVCRLLLDKT